MTVASDTGSASQLALLHAHGLGASGLDVLEQLRRRASCVSAGDEQVASAAQPRHRRLSAQAIQPVRTERSHRGGAATGDLRMSHRDVRARKPRAPFRRVAPRCSAGRSLGELPPSGYRMLWWRQAGTTISKPDLYLQALHRNYSSHDRSLDMHVSHVRGELEALGCTLLQLETVWGIGYMATRVINEPALAALAALLRDNGCVEYGRHPRGTRAAPVRPAGRLPGPRLPEWPCPGDGEHPAQRHPPFFRQWLRARRGSQAGKTGVGTCGSRIAVSARGNQLDPSPRLSSHGTFSATMRAEFPEDMP